ncbi:SURF1 family protein [Methyloceanibacter sp. wino2]|uniref:SURF1 family protein n=1 Tax=Methyloceanibacter sp. wino2 TaxID=2170729 RepID=UPI000D3EB9E3|nr:SURF1 family protein [Methyloceanibacter sp. wino2]
MTTPALIRLTIATLIGFGLLIWLGQWQLQRLEWKERIIQRIETRTERKPVSLEQAVELAKQWGDPNYLRVSAEGRFHHNLERYLYSISSDGEPGWHVIAPLETASGRVVLVDRGFVPDDHREPGTRQEGQVQDIVTVTGLVRTSEKPNLFSPDNDEEANQWFTRDLGGMARSMFPGGTVQVLPFFLEAEASDVPGGWPKGGQTRLELPNKHLQYALTWFLLAACLLVIYAAYVWSVMTGRRS